MNSICNFTQVALGTAVVASVFQNTGITTGAGIIVAIVGALQLIIPFGENAEKSNTAMKKFHFLETDIPTLDEQTASKQLAYIQQEGITARHGMEVLAMNRVCDWHKLPMQHRYSKTFTSPWKTIGVTTVKSDG